MSKSQPLQPGDEIRVIAPSSSKRNSQKRQYERAQDRLEALGYKISFGGSISKTLHQGTAKAEDRASDFNRAYADNSVKAVIAMHGGWAANEILPFIDWGVITANPKPLIGFSDITILLNAIYAKSGVVAYLGPNFASIGYMRSWQYTVDSLNAALRCEAQELKASKLWGVGKEKKGHRTKPWKTLQAGTAQATLIGGNAGTLYLLQGTEYMPSFEEDFILAFEDDDQSGKYTAREFSRRLESLLQLPYVRDNMKGILIGRFQPDSKFTDAELESIITSKKLRDMPVISGIDFGHTLPMLTLPIGGTVNIKAKMGEPPSIFITS